MSFHSRKIIPGLLIALLTACGGGSGGAPDNSLELASNTGQLPATDTDGNQTTPTQPTTPEIPPQIPDDPATPSFVFDDDARFNGLGSIVADTAGNLYVVDFNNKAIRKVATTGDVTTLPVTLSWIAGLAIDTAGNLYTNEGQVIRKIAPDGSKTDLAALPNLARMWTVDSAGHLHALIDNGSGATAIYRVTPEGETTVTVTGERLWSPKSIAADASGNVYVGTFSSTIYKITPDGTATVYTDVGGEVDDMTFDAAGNLFVSMGWYSRPSPGYCMSYPEDCVVKVTGSAIGKVTPDGTRTMMVSFNRTTEVTADQMGVAQITIGSAGYPGGSYVYAAYGKRHAIYKITPDNELRHIAGSPGEPGYSD
jgi:sugar lactone lactonase YvrE